MPPFIALYRGKVFMWKSEKSCFFLAMQSFLNFFVYQKGDIVKDPMKSIPFLPKIVPGVGWGRVGWGGVG